MTTPAEAFYGRLRAREPAARGRLQVLLAYARAGHPEAVRVYGKLAAIHQSFKRGGGRVAGTNRRPGAPRTGYYPMPGVHRAGIETPGRTGVPTPWDLPHRVGTTVGPFGTMDPLQQIMSFLPLTPQALAGLLGMIAQARVAPPPPPMFQVPGIPGLFPGGSFPIPPGFSIPPGFALPPGMSDASIGPQAFGDGSMEIPDGVAPGGGSTVPQSSVPASTVFTSVAKPTSAMRSAMSMSASAAARPNTKVLLNNPVRRY